MLRPTQLTQASFLQKNQMLQNVFLISVTLRWHSGVKNHEIWTFKVNFLCQKTSESFSKMTSNFWRDCAISALKISKKHFATFEFFCKNETCVNCVGLNVTT